MRDFIKDPKDVPEQPVNTADFVKSPAEAQAKAKAVEDKAQANAKAKAKGKPVAKAGAKAKVKDSVGRPATPLITSGSDFTKDSPREAGKGQHQCPYEGCGKSFEKESSLKGHITGKHKRKAKEE